MKKYPNIIIDHSDPNIKIGVEVGISMNYPGPNIPAELSSDVIKRARFVKKFNEELDMARFAENLVKSKNRKKDLLKIAVWVKKNLPNSKLSNKEMVAFGLRLWAGCISAAKGLSDRDARGSIDTSFRYNMFKMIDGYCKEDFIFLAGVESAPDYRKIMSEQIFTEGIPKDSVVRNYIK